jgi:hypothetical protein
MRLWIDTHPYDFKDDNDLNEQLKNFLHDNPGYETHTILDALARSRKVVLLNCNHNMSSDERLYIQKPFPE